MAGTEVSDFKVVLPAKWVELDLDPQTRGASFQRIVADRGAAAMTNGASADELINLLDSVATKAVAVGGVYAAFYSDILGNQQVTASLVVSVAKAKDGAAPAEADARHLVSALMELVRDDGTAQIRELPAGLAVRVQSQVEVPAPSRSPVPTMSIRYILPFPTLDRLAVVEFSTPTLALSEPFANLFDAIAGSIAWT